MSEFLNHPAFQSGIAPLVVALIIGGLLARTRYAWLAIIAGYATMIALTAGFEFSPLTVGRKTVLLGLLAPVVGIAADLLMRRSRTLVIALALVAGALSCWVFATVLQQREGMAAITAGLGIAVFVAALAAAMMKHADDGLRTGAAGLGLGLAVGIAGVLSASIGALMAGISVAAASGAMLLIQVVSSRTLVAGLTGTLTLGVLCGLIPAGTLMLAELPWYALPLLILIPLAVLLRAPERAPLIVRAAVLAGYALIAAALPILAAWYAARGSSS